MLQLQIQDYPLAVEVELDRHDQTELHLGIQGHLELEQWHMELRWQLEEDTENQQSVVKREALAVEVELDRQDQAELSLGTQGHLELEQWEQIVLHLGVQGHLELEQWDMELR